MGLFLPQSAAIFNSVRWILQTTHAPVNDEIDRLLSPMPSTARLVVSLGCDAARRCSPFFVALASFTALRERH
jgi:hypothetical protein